MHCSADRHLAAAAARPMPPQQGQEARLTRLLVIRPPELDREYWTDPSTVRFRAAVDLCGLVMSLLSLAVLFCNLVLRSTPGSLDGWKGLLQLCKSPIYIACNLLHALLFACNSKSYAKWRNKISGLNRLVQVLGNWVHGFIILDAAGYLALFRLGGAPALLSLFSLIGYQPMKHLQLSINFMMPFAYAMPLQLLSAAVVAAIGHHVACAFQEDLVPPCVRQLVPTVCNTVDSAMEGLHWFVSQLSAIPISSGEHVRAMCRGSAGVPALLLFTNLLMCLFVPIFAVFVFEYSHKRHFLVSKGFVVKADISPLLLLPNNPRTSHSLVLLFAPILLWLFSTSVAPMLVPLKC